MPDLPELTPVLFLVGGTVVAALLLRAALNRIGVSALVGYLVLGVGLRLIDGRWPMLDRPAYEIFHFLGQMGLFVLLFRVGLRANLNELLAQLRRAMLVWNGDVLFSGLVGFLAAYYIFGVSVIPSLLIATAMTATSVGVSLAIWQEAGTLEKPEGRLLTDLAELDDITAVLLMALMFAVLPVVHEGAVDGGLGWLVGTTLGLLALKLAGLVTVCYLFARYGERRVTSLLFRTADSPGPMLGIAGIGLVIAAGAQWIGLSLAVGAFLAGLAFSRDPQEDRVEASFEGIYEFFAPLFFISIGLRVEPSVLISALGLGIGLLIVAILGKLVGVWGAASLAVDRSSALVLGISMMPRAEIAMVVMQRGRSLGEWAIPSSIFTAMVFVSLGTCLLAPFLLKPVLKQWRQSHY